MLREMSALMAPVTFSSGAASYFAAVASGNCSGRSTLKTLASDSCSTTAGGGISAFGSAFTSAPQPQRKRQSGRHIMKSRMARFIGSPHAKRSSARSCSEICGGARPALCVSLDHLTTHGKIQLTGGGQIRTNQVQIVQLRGSVVLLCL